jgi:hypothetical protein
MYRICPVRKDFPGGKVLIIKADVSRNAFQFFPCFLQKRVLWKKASAAEQLLI